MPTMPQQAAGWRSEPPVSVPSAAMHWPAATAAAEPPEEPPGTRSMFQGLRVTPKAEFSVEEPIANSSMLVLPTIIAPAAFSLATAVPSYGGTKLPRIFEQQVVRMPFVMQISFSGIGMPRRAAAPPFVLSRASARRASSRALSRQSVTYD